MQPKTLEQLYGEIDLIDPLQYQKTRNYYDGAVTRLSPYLTRGVLTLTEVRDRVLARHGERAAYKLIQELAWRDYFQSVWWNKGDEIFSDLRFPRTDWAHQALVTAIVQKRTGITALNEAVRELETTGYMHNHLRMFVASVTCNLARGHWFPGGQWLYYHLRDGDPASNFLSWQWVAGTSSSKQYTCSQSLINKFVPADWQQSHTPLSFQRDSMIEVPTPDVLQASSPLALVTPYDVIKTDEVQISKSDTVALYTPWTLRLVDKAVDQHVLVIDRAWFDRLPVAGHVLEFIVDQARLAVPSVQIHVGGVEIISGITDAASIIATRHQTNTGKYDWAQTLDRTVVWQPAARLFPHVTDYHKSFFSFWKAIERGS